MRKITIVLISFFCLGITFMEAADEPDETLRLRIGDPALKDKTIQIQAGKIYSARTQAPISFEQMISEMTDSHYIYTGESHNNLRMHEIQRQIAEALYHQDPDLAIGMEMFDVTRQEVLNKWSLGLLSEEEFIQEAEWYVTWNFNFNYYKPVFDLAKSKKIPVYALNAPRKIISKIRMQGWEALSPEEKNLVPEPDVTHEDHRTLMKEVFSHIDMPEAMKGRGAADMMFESLYRAQSAWDEVMAENAMNAAQVENARVMVMAGYGHLSYNLGTNRRVFEKNRLPYKTVICVEVPSSTETIEVSASFADYVWGIEKEKRPAYPSPGLPLKKFSGLDNPVIEKDPVSGVAEGQDFKKGDVLLSADGQKFTSIHDLRRYMSRFTWGDEIIFRLLREGQEVTSILKFAQKEPENCEPED
ncbi:MAG: ChaN family lipoprotein [Candidatus Aminicenantes bacterium]